MSLKGNQSFLETKKKLFWKLHFTRKMEKRFSMRPQHIYNIQNMQAYANDLPGPKDIKVLTLGTLTNSQTYLQYCSGQCVAKE